jgi:hypothetical protein
VTEGFSLSDKPDGDASVFNRVGFRRSEPTLLMIIIVPALGLRQAVSCRLKFEAVSS